MATEFQQFIGTTPAGVQWFAYNPKHVATMTKTLMAMWDRATEKMTTKKGRQ